MVAAMANPEVHVTKDGDVEYPSAHEFFAKLAEDIRKPHYGDQHATFVRELLKQAAEAHLYFPGEA